MDETLTYKGKFYPEISEREIDLKYAYRDQFNNLNEYLKVIHSSKFIKNFNEDMFVNASNPEKHKNQHKNKNELMRKKQIHRQQELLILKM